ncbi:MAG: DNA replication/repair protein RecF [Lachnospiraceae bacterium]|nr:DNA replication/repair protein RecF [Lachnospiraceae bacterium]
MYIENLRLKNYRNYKEISINFDPSINIIYGNNAEGKTNLLESIFLCATSRSHRGSKEKDIINFNEEEAHIKMIFNEKEEKKQVIDIQLNKESKKGIALNGIKKEKLSDFLGTFYAVIFSPEDLNIIKEGPATRRKFIDMELYQIDRQYVISISNYNKVLNQRNAVLKDIYNASGNNKNDLITLLDSYDDQLIRYGTEVILKRKENIEDIAKKIKDIYYKISGEKEELILNYENDVFSSEIEKTYKEKLKETKEQDIKQGYTTIGPHRDDISFIIDNLDLRQFGSQGQKKTAAISLKLAELLIMKEKKGNTPVLLLDDVFSELDEKRQKELIENLDGIQTIITCTGMKRNIYDLLKPNKIFKVSNNEVISQTTKERYG